MVSRILHSENKVQRGGPRKKAAEAKKNLGLVCLCRRHHGLKCQQVATMLRGTDSPGGCCAATPTKTNEVFDLRQEAGEISEAQSKHKCSAVSIKLRFYNLRAACSLADLTRQELLSQNPACLSASYNGRDSLVWRFTKSFRCNPSSFQFHFKNRVLVLKRPISTLSEAYRGFNPLVCCSPWSSVTNGDTT